MEEKKSRMKEKCKKAKMKARAKMVSKENILPPSLPSPPRGQVQCYTAESVKEIYPESKKVREVWIYQNGKIFLKISKGGAVI